MLIIKVIAADLDFGSGQGHNIYRTTSLPDHVTLASISSNSEIWPFESPVISIFHKV